MPQWVYIYTLEPITQAKRSAPSISVGALTSLQSPPLITLDCFGPPENLM